MSDNPTKTQRLIDEAQAEVVLLDTRNRELHAQLEAAEAEWQMMPCYEVNAGRSVTSCGWCHVCIRQSAIRQTLEGNRD